MGFDVARHPVISRVATLKLTIVVVLSMLIQGCACLTSLTHPREFTEIYVRALAPDGATVIPAKIYVGDTGQVLTTELAPTAIRLSKKDGWKDGQIVPIVLDALGFHASVHLIRLSRWSGSREEATLNANNVDIILVAD